MKEQFLERLMYNDKEAVRIIQGLQRQHKQCEVQDSCAYCYFSSWHPRVATVLSSAKEWQHLLSAPTLTCCQDSYIQLGNSLSSLNEKNYKNPNVFLDGGFQNWPLRGRHLLGY